LDCTLRICPGISTVFHIVEQIKAVAFGLSLKSMKNAVNLFTLFRFDVVVGYLEEWTKSDGEKAAASLILAVPMTPL
jgi:hypothetical protein